MTRRDTTTRKLLTIAGALMVAEQEAKAIAASPPSDDTDVETARELATGVAQSCEELLGPLRTVLAVLLSTAPGESVN